MTWGLRFGQRSGVEAPRGGPEERQGRRPALPAAARNNELFRFEVYARANNVLNMVNVQNFSGVVDLAVLRPGNFSPSRTADSRGHSMLVLIPEVHGRPRVCDRGRSRRHALRAA